MYYRILFEIQYCVIYIVDCAIDKNGQTQNFLGIVQFLSRLHKLLFGRKSHHLKELFLPFSMIPISREYELQKDNYDVKQIICDNKQSYRIEYQS